MKALEEGKIDAFAWDGLLLQALRLNSPNPNAFEVTPSTPYVRQGIACMLPEQNSEFRDLVNYTVVKFMQAYVEGKPEAVAIINRWFGAEGATPIDPELIQTFFENIIELHEQIPLN
jgi:polar amino acid transport system substrate-binding protein